MDWGMGVMVTRSRWRLACGGDQTVIRFALAPRWWAWHLALLVVLVSFGWLGWWQLDSFGATAAGTRPSGRSPVLGIDDVTAPGGRLGADDIGARVRATGTWDPEGQLVVPGREVRGRPGALVLTQLVTGEGVLPVVRGWVPEGTDVPAPASGVVTLTGVLQQSETEADSAVAPGGLREGQLSYVATVTLLERLPYDGDELYDGFVVLRSQDPADPVGRLTEVPATDPADRANGTGGQVGRWRNLAYGLQWWLFALAAVVFWGSVLRRSRTENLSGPDPEAGPGGEPAQRSLAAPRRTT